MKYRKCHVTNSSSSSFVCDICGRVESGWDMGIEDVEMYECVNGHTFCWDEALDVNKEDLIKMILEEGWNVKTYYNADDRVFTEEELNNMEIETIIDDIIPESYYEVPECFCPICNFIEYFESDLCKYLLKEYGVPRDEVFAEVKAFNKRRKKLYDNEYITYVCRRFNLNPTEIVAGWKDRFGTYAAFKEYLRG